MGITGEPQIVADYACAIGENPMWHPEDNCLYWVDIDGCKLFRYVPNEGKIDQWDMGTKVGGFTIQQDGALLLFMAEGAVKIWRENEGLTPVITELPEERGNRFNDVIADPEGRVFCGTMSTDCRAGRLYRLDADGTITTLLEGIGTSNGLGFTLDSKNLYYTDTKQHEIYIFDYHQSTGGISNQKTFARTTQQGEGRPDGLTVDSEGCIWSARWSGNRVVRYAPDGRELLHIIFPVPKVSSLTFGGSDFCTAYVTSAGGDKKTEDGSAAGALFSFNLGIMGRYEYRSRIMM